MRRAFTIIESLVTLAALFVLTMLILSLLKYHSAPKTSARPKSAAVPTGNAKTAPLPDIPVKEPAGKN